MAPAARRRTLDVNLTGACIVVHACPAPADAGPLVNIGSAQGLRPDAPGFAAHAASTSGVADLSRALVAESSSASRVNCIGPGMVDTPIADGYRATVGNHALRRLADPLEIARAILHLTRPRSFGCRADDPSIDGAARPPEWRLTSAIAAGSNVLTLPRLNASAALRLDHGPMSDGAGGARLGWRASPAEDTADE